MSMMIILTISPDARSPYVDTIEEGKAYKNIRDNSPALEKYADHQTMTHDLSGGINSTSSTKERTKRVKASSCSIRQRVLVQMASKAARYDKTN